MCPFFIRSFNENNYFGNADDFAGSRCFCAECDTESKLFANAGSFKFNASHSERCRGAAPASAIAHRDGENVATTSERPAGRVGKGQPHGRVGASAKPRALSDCGRREFPRAWRDSTAALSN